MVFSCPLVSWGNMMESLRVCSAPHAWLLFSRKRDRGPIFPGIRQRNVNEAVFLHAPITCCVALSQGVDLHR